MSEEGKNQEGVAANANIPQSIAGNNDVNEGQQPQRPPKPQLRRELSMMSVDSNLQFDQKNDDNNNNNNKMEQEVYLAVPPNVHPWHSEVLKPRSPYIPWYEDGIRERWYQEMDVKNKNAELIGSFAEHPSKWISNEDFLSLLGASLFAKHLDPRMAWSAEYLVLYQQTCIYVEI